MIGDDDGDINNNVLLLHVIALVISVILRSLEVQHLLLLLLKHVLQRLVLLLRAHGSYCHTFSLLEQRTTCMYIISNSCCLVLLRSSCIMH